MRPMWVASPCSRSSMSASRVRPLPKTPSPARLLGLVDLHQVDAVPLQPLQAGLEAAQHRVAGIVEGLREVAHLGGQEEGLLHPLQRVTQDLLAAAAAVEGGRVDVVDAQLEGALDDGGAVGDRPRAELGTAVEPGAAEGDLADLPAGLAEPAVAHQGDAAGGRDWRSP